MKSTSMLAFGLAVAFAAAGLAPDGASASPPPAFFWGLPSAVWEYGGPSLTGIGMNQSFSGDGNFTVFESDELLTPDATGHQRHVYRRQTSDGSLRLISQRVRPSEPFGASYNPSISADGNIIAFETTDSGIFSEDPLCVTCTQIALADVSGGTVDLVSRPRGTVAPGEEGDSTNAMVSSDGAHVVFTSRQPGMSNTGAKTFPVPTIESWNRSTGDITGVTAGKDFSTTQIVAPNGLSDGAVISADGRFVAFTSAATNLGVAQTTRSLTTTPALSHVYRWDAQTGSTILVSTSISDTSDTLTKTDDDSYLPSISADGDRIGFISGATNLIGTGEVPKTANHMTDAYVRSVSAQTTHRISVVMVDEPRPDIPDSHGGTPSVSRSRRWWEPWVSTTRVSLAADGQSAVLTSMTPLLDIHGDCMSCQTFQDNNNALDVFHVRLSPEGRPTFVQPISLKRDNQTFGNEMDLYLRDSSTGGGDSIADGKTPVTSDGSQIAFSSQAGDLRGVASLSVLDDSGPPYYLPQHRLPAFIDGGVPDEYPDSIRTFTVASNAFNPHLELSATLAAKLATDPLQTVQYETRSRGQAPLAAAPAATAATSFLSPSSVVPGSSGIVYGLTLTARSSGSAEVVLDLEQLGLETEASLPAYWKRAESDAPNTLTYRTTQMNVGDTAVFSLHLKNTNTEPGAISAAVTATVNGIAAPSAARARLAPAPPACIVTPEVPIVVAGVATAIRGLQCTATKASLKVQASHGTASINATGILTYSPDVSFRGTDSLSVTAIDGALRSSAPVSLDVKVDGIAVPADDAYEIIEGQTLTVGADRGLTANDTFTGVSGSWPIQQGYSPQHGTLELNGTTGAFTFKPEAGFLGDVTFKYLLRGTGWAEGSRSTPATVTIHVLEKK